MVTNDRDDYSDDDLSRPRRYWTELTELPWSELTPYGRLIIWVLAVAATVLLFVGGAALVAVLDWVLTATLGTWQARTVVWTALAVYTLCLIDVTRQCYRERR